MEEVANVGSETEVAAPEMNPQAVVETPKTEESQQDKTWLRNLRRRQDELNQIVKSQAEMIEQLKAQTIKPEPDEFEAISDEEFIPKGKVNKLVEKKAERIAHEKVKQEIERFKAEQHQSQFLDKLKKEFSDFEEVVTPETLAILEETNPRLANTIAELKDPYKIGLQSYEYIKALNLANKVPQKRRANEVEKKIEDNAKTVQTPQAYDKRPLAQAFKLTDAMKSDLYKEMMQYASLAGGGY